MLGFRSGRFQVAVASAFAALLALGTAGCAGSGSATAQAAAKNQGVSDVQIEYDGSDTIVMLMGPEHPVFTAHHSEHEMLRYLRTLAQK